MRYPEELVTLLRSCSLCPDEKETERRHKTRGISHWTCCSLCPDEKETESHASIMHPPQQNSCSLCPDEKETERTTCCAYSRFSVELQSMPRKGILERILEIWKEEMM